MLARDFSSVTEIDKYLENCFVRFEKKKEKIIRKIEKRTGFVFLPERKKINIPQA